jgi:hypothetical protein
MEPGSTRVNLLIWSIEVDQETVTEAGHLMTEFTELTNVSTPGMYWHGTCSHCALGISLCLLELA